LKVRALIIVVGFELRRMLLGPHGVLIALALLVSLVPTCFWARRLAEQLVELRSDAVGMPPLAPLYGAVAWFTDLPREEIDHLFSDHPPHLLAFFAACIWLVPPLTYVTGFDQTATDIRSRHLRFLLLRVSRGTLFLGRALSTLIVLAIAYALAVIVMATLLSGVDQGLGGSAGVVYLARVWLSLVVFTVPFVALLAWTNSATGHPYMALAACVALQFGLWMLAVIGGWTEMEALEWAPRLFPTAYEYNLLSDDGELLWTALGHQLGLAALFAALGWRSFRSRDV